VLSCIELFVPAELKRLVAFTCILLILLAGCGGHAGPASSLQWQYTALGDSLAVGVLDSQGGYARRFRTDIASDTDAMVTLSDLGVNGAHSSDLLNSLQNDANFRNAVASSQVVTWDIGGDDLLHAIGVFQNGQCGGADNQDCLRAAVATFMPNWDAIVQQLLAMRDKNQTIIRTMDIYNPFVAQLQAQGLFSAIEPYLDQVNQHIAASAQANGIPMAQVHSIFNGANGTDDPIAKGLITVDGIHPNDVGHQAIAEALRSLGYAPLH
jgi:lysophospholipase L1-like esterase